MSIIQQAHQQGQGQVSLAALCDHQGLSRQAYYQQRQREAAQQAEDDKILCLVHMIRQRHPRMGTRKLLVKLGPFLEREGLQIGRDGLFALLREHDLLIAAQRRGHRTTWAGRRRAPNRLAGQTFTRPDAAWVADITYLDLAAGGFAYLFLLMDLYSRYLIGWSLAPTLAGEHALQALQQGLHQTTQPVQGTIHHSDHGAQYSSQAYWDCLSTHGLQPSMGEVGNAYDNAYAERVVGTLKREYALDSVFRTEHDLQQAVAQAIHLYNTDRPHLALDYVTPQAVYQGGVTAKAVFVVPVETLP